MQKDHLPTHLLRVEWQMLHMTGDFETAIQRASVRDALESSARAREARERRRAAARVDIKRLQAGDAED
ncbi:MULTISPECIES: hypothetical protein [Burkholderia]|uniref:hypothetical protein n=2 Tax=Burkholderiaceae TaxID=119060 RepID=UPI00067921C8|nr:MULTISPECIES: hypothetical protein [Burkholderia]ARL36727.1 hypothetical protein BOC49_11040 [Burkholderia pseudomallei]KWU26797.1 hypothetical protein AS149_05610 [Burkholderia cenocepacia]MBR8509610.1 hypothetical protein [Burkholderia cenocepacia]QVN14830.1 hypothetical protein JYG37_22285 [Burkholderia sp. LAS2]